MFGTFYQQIFFRNAWTFFKFGVNFFCEIFGLTDQKIGVDPPHTLFFLQKCLIWHEMDFKCKHLVGPCPPPKCNKCYTFFLEGFP